MLNSISGRTAVYGLSAYNISSAAKPKPEEKAKNTDVLSVTGKGFSERIAAQTSNIASGIRNADDSSRVEQIAQRIKSGMYNVPAEDVARAILGLG